MKIHSLGSVLFNDIVEQELYIEEEHTWIGVGQNIRYALSGSIYVSENERKGRPLTLIASEDRAWLTKATVLALKALASSLGTFYGLSLTNDENENEFRQVLFKRQSSPLEIQPLDPSHRFYVGKIHLIQPL
jgi:hypothetical protein